MVEAVRVVSDVEPTQEITRELPREIINDAVVGGKLIEGIVAEGKQLMFDVDGVVGDGRSEEIVIAEEGLIEALRILEDQVDIGIATARNIKAIEELRGKGLKIKGDCIFEEGHVVVRGGKIKRLSTKKHRGFIRAVKDRFGTERRLEGFGIGLGLSPWQGEARVSLAIKNRMTALSDEQIISQLMWDFYECAEPFDGFDVDSKVVLRMRDMGENGQVLVVSAKKGRRLVDKGMAGEELIGSWTFFGDGPGDLSLAQVTVAKGGRVVGVGESSDVTSEIGEFISLAGNIFENREVLVKSFNAAESFLG